MPEEVKVCRFEVEMFRGALWGGTATTCELCKLEVCTALDSVYHFENESGTADLTWFPAGRTDSLNFFGLQRKGFSDHNTVAVRRQLDGMHPATCFAEN